MNDLDNPQKYAIILIYPDGMIDKIARDEKIFHMEYFIELSHHSKRLNNFIKHQNILMPKDTFEAKMMRTIEIDTKLANHGVITIHNLFLDQDVRDEIEDWEKDFYITMPHELSENQKEIIKDFIDNYDMSNNWFGIYNNDKFDDATIDEVMSMIQKKGK